MRKSLTLYELNALVRETLALQMPDEYWVEAELSEAREVRGHCYMELIQKDDRSNTPVAQGFGQVLGFHVAVGEASFYARHRSASSCRHEGLTEGLCPIP